MLKKLALFLYFFSIQPVLGGIQQKKQRNQNKIREKL